MRGVYWLFGLWLAGISVSSGVALFYSTLLRAVRHWGVLFSPCKRCPNG